MATRISPPQNKTYYINPAYLTFVENSGYGANLIQVSASSSCYISVYDPANGIGYSDADRNYQRWKVTAYNNKFPDNEAWYIYVRLERKSTSALVMYDKVLRGVKGGEITVSKDEQGNDVYTEGESTQEVYWFIRIGDVTATDGTTIRRITYDTGYLESDEGKNSTDPNDMWELIQGTTPWLIRAKHWLTSFTLKGFLTLIGGLVFKKDGGEEKRVVDIMRTTDSGDPNESNYVPIDDTTIPTTAWVRSQNDDRYLKKYEPDETQYRIKFFDGIEAGHFVKGMIGGSGTQFDGDGYGEMNGLTLREFLEVPELRFNRIDVVSGELWNSVAFGLIEKVDTERCIAWLKLEERERAGLHVYDICRGIFADFGDGTQWEGVDECGFLHLYGFWTAYFTPTEIIENGEGTFSFRYQLKPGTTQHPTPSMKFAVYGNFVDESRQASAYSTRTYKRYLNKVDTWVIDPDKHIYAQYGELNGLTIGGKTMTGYGSFQSNVYITGGVFEFTPQQKLELQGESAYSVTLSDYEGVVTIDDEGNIIGGEMELQNVITEGQNVITDGQNVVTASYRLRTQVQAMRGSEVLFYSPTSPSEGSFAMSISTVGCTAMIVNGTVVVTSVFHTERCYVSIVVNCEGKASFTQTYNIHAVRDGRNPIIADIDNEMDSVACDSYGKVLFGLPVSCTVSMWAGTIKLELDRMEISAPEGVTYTSDKSTGIVTVTGISTEAERTLPLNITAYASYGGTQYHKELVFTVNKVNAGENALLYKLSPSVSSVKVDDSGAMTATSISCEVVSSNGSTITTLDSLPAGVTMQYYLDKDVAKNYTYKSAVSVNSGTKTVTFKLYAKGELIDVETIPILLDGSSPIIVDLDNEMQSVACDEHGAVVLGLPLSTGVKAFYGSKELTLGSLTVGAVSGVTASASGSTVTVTAITKDAPENIRIPITVKATHDKEYTRTVYLIVNKLKQGNSAVVVDLVPSVSAIKVDSKNVYTPTTISCLHKVTTGKDGSSIPAALQENYTMKYAIDADTTPDAYTYGAALPTASIKTSITFYLYYKGVLVDRETVPVVKDGASSFKSTVFYRSNSTPSAPTGGSYDSPIPTSSPQWEDGIPAGEAILWASVCTFRADGNYPEDAKWSTPRQMTDTAGFDVEWSSVASNPGNPTSNPSNWSNTASSSTIWMATRTKSNGVWSSWQISKIKGEDGTNGGDGKDGSDGADAEWYEIGAAVASIGYTMTGSYSPGKFIVSEYHVKGASRIASNNYYIFIYGVKTTGSTYLTYTSTVNNYTFNADQYYSYDFDSFRFELRETSSSSSALIAEISVPIARKGENGIPGPMPRYCGFFEYGSGVTYVYDDSYRDIVVYDGDVYQVLVKGNPAPDTILPTNTSYWEKASKFSFVAMDTALIDGANIAGFMFKDKLLQSQDGTLSLNGANGEVIAGTTYKMRIDPDVDGYPSLRWLYGNNTLASLSLNTPEGGYVSGQLTLSDIAGRTSLFSPSFVLVGGSTFQMELNASLTTECTLAITKTGVSGGYKLSVGMDYSGYGRIGCRWPTSSSSVNVGEVYLDGNTLKVRTS